MDIDDARPRYDSWRQEREREHFLWHSGENDAPAFDEVDDRHSDVTGGELLEPLRARLEGETFTGLRDAHERLVRLIEEAVLVARSWELGRELRSREKAQASEGELAELREELFCGVGEERAKLGFATGLARFAAAYPELDEQAWARASEALLERTEPSLRDRVDPALQRIGMLRSEARADDVLGLAQRSDFDALFPPQRLMPSLDFTTEGMGLRLSATGGIEVDAQPRPERVSGTRAFGVRVPGLVCVSVGRLSGVRAHRELFAAAGRAFAAAFTSAELAVERRRGLDPALAHGWGLLLSECLGDPGWIDASPAQVRASELVEEHRLHRLLRIRRAAAAFRFELELARLPAGADPHALAERFSEEFTVATGAPASGEGYLVAADPELGALHELRAWCFATQLAEFLRERHGRLFWRERRAAELLKELWNTGSTYTAEGIAAELGFGPLDAEHLIETR